jgi:translation elongation factor EF-Ts
MCCDCNTIASIVEKQSIAQLVAQQKLFEDLKDHIDKRALEIIIKDLEHLKALDFEQFLKAIMQRINESEANLWNGAPR